MKNERMAELIVECAYCGIICVGTGTRDHVIPRSLMKIPQTQKSNWYRRNSLKDGNKAYACRRCNEAKADMPLDDFRKTEYWRINITSRRWKGLYLYRDKVSGTAPEDLYA